MSKARSLPAVAALAMSVALVSCSAPVASGSTVFDAEGVRVEAPPGWSVLEARMESLGAARILVYIANQPLGDDCPNDPDAGDCRLLLDGLAAGGVFMWWRTVTCVAAGCELPQGEPIVVGRREAVRSPAPSVVCAGLGATNEEQVAVVVTPQRVDTIYICSRDPNAATLAGVESVIDSIVWRTP